LIIPFPTVSTVGDNIKEDSMAKKKCLSINYPRLKPRAILELLIKLDLNKIDLLIICKKRATICVHMIGKLSGVKSLPRKNNYGLLSG
jgi:hypothetical protein